MHRKFWILSLTVVSACLLLSGVIVLTQKTPGDGGPGGSADACRSRYHRLHHRHQHQRRWRYRASAAIPSVRVRCAGRSIKRAGIHRRVRSSASPSTSAPAMSDMMRFTRCGLSMWTATSASETFAFRDFGTYGRVIVDGTTQPIGRDLAVGPRIILRGDNDKGAFNLAGGNNVVRGLAFQAFGDNVVQAAGTNNNLIEGNWFGLTVDGRDIHLRNAVHPEDGSGEGGIFVQMSGSNGANNTIQDNVLVGFKAGAINVQGSYNFVLSNTVGTRADGTVPDVSLSSKCRAQRSGQLVRRCGRRCFRHRQPGGVQPHRGDALPEH